MLIDYLVGAAIAITGMLALLVFGTEIIRLNAEARDRWQARSALVDFEGRWQVSGDSLPAGTVCQQPRLQWVVEWCESPAVSSLPNATAFVELKAASISLRWYGNRNAATPELTITRELAHFDVP